MKLNPEIVDRGAHVAPGLAAAATQRYFTSRFAPLDPVPLVTAAVGPLLPCVPFADSTSVRRVEGSPT